MESHSPDRKKRTYSELSGEESPQVSKVDEVYKENFSPEISRNSSSRKTYSKADMSNFLNLGKATPKKYLEFKEEPITPTSNIKLLTSIAAERDYVNCNTPKSAKLEKLIIIGDETFSLEPQAESIKQSRKEKSLALVCSKFLEMFPLNLNPTEKIVVSLDDVSQKLKVERRRLYDIVNVFESIDMLTKIAKNQYIWYGKNNLLISLQTLRRSAIEEGIERKLEYVLKQEDSNETVRQSCILDDVQFFNQCLEFEEESVIKDLNLYKSPFPEVRKEKSLALMSQKFLMLFLISPSNVISLGVAAKVLNGFQKNKGAQIKTQIRRLYDIANVLSSIKLIEKAVHQGVNRKKPAYRYIGPDLKDFKENDIPIKRIRLSLNTSIKPRSLSRHSSFQEICDIAEVEHQKLIIDHEAPKSAPPFQKSLLEPSVSNTTFTNWSLNMKNSQNQSSDSSETHNFIPVGNNSFDIQIIDCNKSDHSSKPSSQILPATSTAPPFVAVPQVPKLIPRFISKKGSLYVLNNSNFGNTLPTNSTGSIYVVNQDSASNQVAKKKLNVSPNHIHKITKHVPIKPKKDSENTSGVSKTIELSPAQRDAILKSLNITLSEGQVAAIQLAGNSSSFSLNSTVQNNMLKIIENPCNFVENNESSQFKITSAQSISPSNIESNGVASVYSTRNNSPNVIRNLSPFSIPSGYATPTLGASSDITSFPSNSEVEHILNKIENGSDSIDSIHSELHEVNSTSKAPKLMSLKEMKIKQVLKQNFVQPSQAGQVLENFPDNCSNESYSAEVSNILKETRLGETSSSTRSHSFLIDEKTILSPIKKSKERKTLTHSPLLIPPPYIRTDSMFVLNPSMKLYKSIANSISAKLVDNKNEGLPSKKMHLLR